MTLMQRTLTGVCTVALLATVGCGNDNNETTNNTTANNTTANNTTANNTTANNTTANNTTANNTTANNTTANNTTANNTTANNTTTTTGPSGTYCRLECAAAADCGDATLFECNNNRCDYIGDAGTCTANDECTATFSGWVTTCQTDADCPGQVCIDTGDAAAGRCATEAGGVVACDTFGQADFATTKFEDASATTVCANTSAECHADGYCFVPCVDDTTCGGLTCDTTTGNCFCENDGQCPGSGADKCYDGTCGCAAEASCDVLEVGGPMYTCE